MAKRFGRNQKRRMLEQHAQLVEKLEQVTDVLERQRENHRRLEQRLDDWANEILHLVGENSAYLETLSRMGVIHGDRVRFAPRVNRLHSLAYASSFSLQETAMRVIEAMVVTLEVQPDAIEPRYFVVMANRYNDERLTMAIDKELWRDPSPRLIRTMADSIARQMGEALKAGASRAVRRSERIPA